MFRKKPVRPLYQKKSKALKQIEREDKNVYTANPTKQKGRRRPKLKQSVPSVRQKDNLQKGRDHSGYRDPYYNDFRAYSDDGNWSQYNQRPTAYYEDMTEEEIYEYRHPGRRTTYISDSASDDLYSEEQWERDSEMDQMMQRRDVYQDRSRWRRGIDGDNEMDRVIQRRDLYDDRSQWRRGVDVPSEHDLEYNYHSQRPRLREEPRNERSGGRHPLNRSPYREDYNVYVAHDLIGHRAFKYKDDELTKDENLEQYEESDFESLEDEDEIEEEVGDDTDSAKQQQYTVYAAQMEQNPSEPFKQQKSHEEILSTTNFNRNVPVVAFRQNRMNQQLLKDVSSIVYLPVLMMDSNNNKILNSKYVYSQLLLNEFKEKAEKPLDKNLQIYAAMTGDNGNIFEQAQTNITEQPSVSHNITIYTVGKTESSPIKQKRSKTVIAAKKSGSKITPAKSHNSIKKKSYIKVVPSNVKPDNKSQKSSSKLGLAKLFSKLSSHSLIGSHKSRSVKGSGFYSKARKQDLEIKKINSKKEIPKKSPHSLLVSVSKPTNEVDSEQKQVKVSLLHPSLSQQKKLLAESKSTLSDDTPKQPEIKDEINTINRIFSGITHQQSEVKSNEAIPKQPVTQMTQSDYIPQQLQRESTVNSIKPPQLREENTVNGIMPQLLQRESTVKGVMSQQLQRQSTDTRKLENECMPQQLLQKESIVKSVVPQQLQRNSTDTRKLENECMPQQLLQKESILKSVVPQQLQRNSTDTRKLENECMPQQLLRKESTVKSVVPQQLQRNRTATRKLENECVPQQQHRLSTVSGVISSQPQRKSTVSTDIPINKQDEKPITKSEIISYPEHKVFRPISEPTHRQGSKASRITLHEKKPLKSDLLQRTVHEKRKKGNTEIIPEDYSPINPTDIPENYDPYTFQKITSSSSILSLELERGDSDKWNTISKPVFGVKGHQSKTSMKIWGFDITPLIFLFQCAQYFLGLSIHDKVMEVYNVFN